MVFPKFWYQDTKFVICPGFCNPMTWIKYFPSQVFIIILKNLWFPLHLCASAGEWVLFF